MSKRPIELLLNQREPVKVYSCKGGNIINTDGLFKSATAAVYYTVPCCGEGPKPLTAAQKAARAKAAAQAKVAAQAKAEAEARAAAAAWAAEQKAIQDRVDAENAALAAGWAANARNLYGNCSRRGSIQSVENSGDEATSIRMFNKGSKNINIYWIDTQGNEVNYASQDAPIRSIAAGPAGDEEYGAPGYWYIATDDSGECVGIGNSVESNGQFDFGPGLVVPGANPRKAVSNSDAFDQGGYVDDGSPYVDQNEYAYDQSELDDYVDPNEYTDDQTGYEGQDEYSQDDQQDYSDYSGQDETVSGQGPGCEYMGQISSSDGGEIVEVQFENPSDQTIDLYWIDASGQANNYQGTGEAVISLPAQSYHMVGTKIGYYFVGGDVSGNCRGIAEISYSGETISFPALQ